MVVNTGTNERSHIILGRLFSNTVGAIIYSSTAKIIFNIKSKREVSSFKDKALSFPTQKETVSSRNKSKTQSKTKNKGKKKAQKMETARMVTTVHREYDHLLKSPHLIKKDNPGVSTILCSIDRCYFYNTIYNIRAGVNLMDKVTYEFLYGSMPMDPTYAQLQMAD